MRGALSRGSASRSRRRVRRTHVQYSWFGMVVIFTLGVTLGLIRRTTSTSVAMLVHAAYDMVAVFTT